MYKPVRLQDWNAYVAIFITIKVKLNNLQYKQDKVIKEIIKKV